MARLYIRLDPEIYDRLVVEKGWTDTQFTAYIGTLCAAEKQDWRGRFRNKVALKAQLLARHSRLLDHLLQEKSLVPITKEGGSPEKDPPLAVVGWDPWQEGNLTPRQREAAIRALRGEKVEVSAAAERTRRWREKRHSEASPVETSDAVTGSRHRSEPSDASLRASHSRHSSRGAGSIADSDIADSRRDAGGDGERHPRRDTATDPSVEENLPEPDDRQRLLLDWWRDATDRTTWGEQQYREDHRLARQLAALPLAEPVLIAACRKAVQELHEQELRVTTLGQLLEPVQRLATRLTASNGHSPEPDSPASPGTSATPGMARPAAVSESAEHGVEAPPRQPVTVPDPDPDDLDAGEVTP
jgi:hypothetical protein